MNCSYSQNFHRLRIFHPNRHLAYSMLMFSWLLLIAIVFLIIIFSWFPAFFLLLQELFKLLLPPYLTLFLLFLSLSGHICSHHSFCTWILFLLFFQTLFKLSLQLSFLTHFENHFKAYLIFINWKPKLHLSFLKYVPHITTILPS